MLTGAPPLDFVFQPTYAPYSEADRAVVEGVAVVGPEGAALRDLGPRSVRRWRRRPGTGTPIAIPSSGAGGAAINPVAALALGGCQKPHELSGCTT